MLLILAEFTSSNESSFKCKYLSCLQKYYLLKVVPGRKYEGKSEKKVEKTAFRISRI